MARRAGLLAPRPRRRRTDRGACRDRRTRHRHHPHSELRRRRRRPGPSGADPQERAMTAIDPLARIRMQVMWNRLLAVVEEQGQTLVRTAFSTSAREAGDISAGVFDTEGRMLAPAVTGTPGHLNPRSEERR